ncbi:unnamed protein product [Ranitomeya imitator]|uniref:Uncharacterized protein n=1 Tax=Ranitomeya imitator TaxID=111125 RepID=A0ABN9L7M9_9NEOB|nr:unnamed protein product [Ranitomeya imitator]
MEDNYQKLKRTTLKNLGEARELIASNKTKADLIAAIMEHDSAAPSNVNVEETEFQREVKNRLAAFFKVATFSFDDCFAHSWHSLDELQEVVTGNGFHFTGHTCELKTIPGDYLLKLIKKMPRVCKAVIKGKVNMKDSESIKNTEEQLFLDIDLHHDDTLLPLHTSIVLFLMSYCDCKTLKTFLVIPEDDPKTLKEGLFPSDLNVSIISRKDLPAIVQSCRLPAVLEDSGAFCRAGLAVVLRHIIQRTFLSDPSRKDVIQLLGFKKTCLKACAEVSQWTRLCEISIPLAVETFLKDPSAPIPPEVLQLERKLGEPVRVHNDDKIRRQKMQQQMKSNDTAERKEEQEETSQSSIQKPPSLELTAALSKLSVQDVPSKSTREPAHIRKARNADLPSLEHVFAEGLYFTLTDVVLLPCIHHFLSVEIGLHKDDIRE